MSRVEKVLLALLPTVFLVAVLTPGEAVEPAAAEVVFSFTDDAITESSGLVAREDAVLTVNDSGDTNRVFVVDPATGGTADVLTWPGDAVDIEALAPGADGAVFVGDIGDNAGSREEVAITRLRGDGGSEAASTTWRFAYSDGPHDAETLLVHPVTGRIYVVAKEFIGRVYEAPTDLDADRLNTLSPLTEPDGRVLGIATDGAFFPDGAHLILRNYGQAAVYTWPELDRLGTFDLPAQQQGEGIAVSASGEILISSEGDHADVLRVELPADLQAAMADDGSTGSGADSGESPAESPAVDHDDRDWWPWALGGLGAFAGVLLVAVLRPGRGRA